MTVVVDSSAMIAVLFGEPDARFYAGALTDQVGDLHVSAVSVVETAMVVESRLGAASAADLQTLISRLSMQVEPVTPAQADLALRAWRRFGKGRHPARLNLGDCFSYALAISLGARLLYKGDDFSQTDVSAALT
jgi:ribonuclease VapC